MSYIHSLRTSRAVLYDGDMVRWIAIVMACAMGCGGGADQPPTMPMVTQLVGDWFLCDAADCSTLKNHGAQWTADARWVLLEVRGAQSLDPTGTYCTSPYDANQGTYTFDEASGALAMTDDLGRDAGSSTVTFTPPTATLAQTNGVSSLYARIDPPRLTGDCPVP